MTTRAQHIDALARTLWGEARGEGIAGMEAVAAVAMNRMRDQRRWPNDITGVVRQPRQFSAWNVGDPNRTRMLLVDSRDPQFRQAMEIATRAYDGQLEDPTKGSNHYHTHSVNPVWSRGKKPVVKIGNHRFFKL